VFSRAIADFMTTYKVMLKLILFSHALLHSAELADLQTRSMHFASFELADIASRAQKIPNESSVATLKTDGGIQLSSKNQTPLIFLIVSSAVF
jgi:hypothetical protein